MNTAASEAPSGAAATQRRHRYELIAIGTSWGGLQALSLVLDTLPDDVEQPLVVAQHRSPASLRDGFRDLLQRHTSRIVRDAEDKVPLEPRHVYLAPPDYHLLVERTTLALSIDEAVNFARPSIDVLFDSVADAFGDRAIGVVLTGASDDGAAGLARIKERGGVAIVQDPGSSVRRRMPEAAIAATQADAILPLEEIGKFLYGVCCEVDP